MLSIIGQLDGYADVIARFCPYIFILAETSNNFTIKLHSMQKEEERTKS
jgi:hypothetical protein